MRIRLFDKDTAGLTWLGALPYSCVLPARWYLDGYAKDDELARNATDALADELAKHLEEVRQAAWPDLPVVQVGENRAVGFVSDEPPVNRAKLNALIDAVEGLRQDKPTEHAHAYRPRCHQDGDGFILDRDAAFAHYLEGLGPRGKEAAGVLRVQARKRGTAFCIESAEPSTESIWHVWEAPAAHNELRLPVGEDMWTLSARLPRFLNTLVDVVWLDIVRPRLEREAKKALVPVRMPTDMSRTFAMARSSGGAVVGTSILVEPPSGVALTLPFDDDLKVSRRNGGDMVNLRQVLSPGALRTYLATLVLFQDHGMREDGSFEIEGPGTILDVTGATKHEERKGKAVYRRYATKDTKAVTAHLETFGKMRVRVVGELEAAAGDALLDEISDRRNGRVVTYAHSRLIAAQLKHNYVRIPRAVCKLAPGDVPLGMGIATMARTKVLALLKKNSPIEAPIEAWLDACGLDAAEGARKHGRAYWAEAADDLSRVAEDGRLGQMKVSGNGRDAVLTLKLHADLRESYAPLLEAAKGHERAKRAAMVANHRRRPK